MTAVGSIVRFRTYQHYGVITPPVFEAGDILRIVEEEVDGVFRCVRLNARGKVIPGTTDLTFREELEFLNRG